MSWGPGFFYYQCSACGKKFKYAQDMIPEFGADFGKCPVCGTMGTYIKDGPRGTDDADYYEVED